MVGHHSFARLTERLPSASRARIEARKGALRAAMPLHELRRARAMTQRAVGAALDVQQPAVAKLERRTDMYVSNLRAYIEAIGGRLDIVARFPQGSVTITNFSEVGGNGPEAGLAPESAKP
ncbi:MAG: XRE family transcriptional regulator [Rhodobacter sp.]|nr:XRE family transcriptional regulator [Rhodobacter sp.]